MEYFTDPVLRAPTIGCMLMCLSAALVGVITFLRKQSLLGESLSHAAYPGVIIGAFVAGITALTGDAAIVLSMMIGASLTALIGLWAIKLLEERFSIRSDSALCFVLSAFFGIGLTLASRMQFRFSALYKQSLTYLYGQAATMTDIHILIYGLFALLIIVILLLLYKELKVITFDRDFAISLGIQTHWIDTTLFVLIVLAVVIGIRSVGVVLMSAMLIAPAAAARQYTHRLSIMLILSGTFGLVSGYFGNVLSVQATRHFDIGLPTGPMIVLVATAICLFSLLLAPERGLLMRYSRAVRFRYRCLCENILKAIWRISPCGEVPFEQIAACQTLNRFSLKIVLRYLKMMGWLTHPTKTTYQLTKAGCDRAAHIVRLHRLWEVYLADYLGVGAERVHANAEEIEHILTPEIEKELIILLKNPQKDPHQQPIPQGGCQ